MIASKSEEYAVQLEDPALRDILSEESCRRDPESAFERGILDPLQRLHAPESGTRYLLVDALDEALGVAAGETSIVQLLASRLDRLPPWLRIVATTRKDPRVLDRLKGLRAEELEAQSENNLLDLTEFIEAELRSPDFVEQVHESSAPPRTIVNQLIEKSDGNFLYVRQAMEAIRTKDASFASLQDLPPGLSGLYAHRFDRLFPSEAAFESLVPLLEVICAAREPVTRPLLAAACGMDERAVERHLVKMAGYLIRHKDEQNRPSFAVYHKSLADWLTDPEREAQFHWASLKSGHCRLADWCLENYRRDSAKMDRYALCHIARHIIAAGQWDELIGDADTPGLLSDLLFIEAKCTAGLVHDLVMDYNTALAALPEFAEENAWQARYSAAMVAYNKALREYAGEHYEWQQAKERGEMQPEPSYPPMPVELREEENRKLPEESSPRAARFRHFSNFVNSRLALLGSKPCETLPLAFNYAADGPVAADAQRRINSREEPRLCRSPRPPAPPLRPQCLKILEGHGGSVTEVALSPDGRRAISGSGDATLRVWDLESGQCLKILEGHGGWVGSVALSPDGRRALSGSSDKTVRVWDLDSGQCLNILEGHSDSVESVALSPDGRRALSGSSDKTVRVWDLESGQ
ncbi:MAG: WD40 repeat domain-containing protein, partial [Pontiellaceae bacterium]|nr:WD40 repeat domain-containing protein [Pontiellaceae bacterium]